MLARFPVIGLGSSYFRVLHKRCSAAIPEKSFEHLLIWSAGGAPLKSYQAATVTDLQRDRAYAGLAIAASRSLQS